MSLKRFTPYLVFIALAVLLLSCSGETSIGSQISDPSPATLQLSAGSSDSFSFTNQGALNLAVDLSSNVAWVKVLPASATLAPGETLTAGVTADCAGQPSSSRASVIVRTSDPAAPSKVVGVDISCPDGEPSPGTPSASGYSIDLRFSGSDFTAARRTVFLRAAERWSSLITDDLPTVSINKSSNGCGPAFSGDVDDLMIYAVIRPIDGPGNVLGQAGPCYIRQTGSRLPVFGIMEFDSADVLELEADGQLETVILHEMGHVLGIGTLWDAAGAGHSNLDYKGDGADCSSTTSFTVKPSFNGAAAGFEYGALGGEGQPPVEDGYGAGTKCGHWDEELFAEELMTGYLDAGSVPLSRLTIASLADMGYGVNYDAAEDYALRGCVPDCLLPQSVGAIRINEVLVRPLGEVSPDGTILEVRPE